MTALPTRRQLWWAVIGFLVAEAVWILAVPPFRGSDEFDHVYRAAAVARGQVIASPEAATRGTGAWMLVPPDIAKAAQAPCQELPYTSDADCIGSTQGDRVRIASGAGRYPPLYYALVGTPARPFSGDAAVYVMRAVSALLSAGLFAATLFTTRRWAATRWPFLGIALGCTPVMVFSGSLVAPNGAEMLAALLAFTGLIGLTRAPQQHFRVLAVAAATGLSLVALIRPLGPFWAALIGLTVVVLAWPGRERVQALVRRRDVLVAGVVAVGCAGLGSLWALTQGALNVGSTPEEALSLGARLQASLSELPLWILQSIAAFPLRNEQSPAVVYATGLVLFLMVLLLALRGARRSRRWSLLALVLLAAAVPLAITTAAGNDHAGVWQGRYGLPYALGIGLFAALALEERERPAAIRQPYLVVWAGLAATAAGVGIAAMVARINAGPLWRDNDRWVHLPFPILVVLMAGAIGSIWIALGNRSTPSRTMEPHP